MLPMKYYTCILPAKVSWVLGVVSVASFSAVLALEASLCGLEATDDMVLLSAQLSKVLSHIATLHAREREGRVVKILVLIPLH